MLPRAARLARPSNQPPFNWIIRLMKEPFEIYFMDNKIAFICV